MVSKIFQIFLWGLSIPQVLSKTYTYDFYLTITKDGFHVVNLF